MPCGECCTAWANCCTNLVSRGECSQNHSSQTTEMDPIPQVSGHIYTSTVVLEPPRPPPDNHALQGITYYLYYTLFIQLLVFTQSYGQVKSSDCNSNANAIYSGTEHFLGEGEF